MRRFFAENVDISSGSVILSGDEARHIRDVLRMKKGDKVLLINGAGTECTAEISGFTNGTVGLSIIGSSVSSREPAIEVTLFQCLAKQGKMEVIIQKCVELGVHTVVPTISNRCVVKLDGKDAKLARWNKVSVEAAKQCGRAFVPCVLPAVRLDRIDLSPYDCVLTAYENEDDTTLKTAPRSIDGVKKIAVIIGPEGGFELSEVEMLADKGAKAVSLGKRILRTETAGMAMLAQIMYEFDE
jgi:16S rRNA (uracil1498-N3)-methyltransferase